MKNEKTKTKGFVRVPRTTMGLRDALFDELDSLRNGKTNPQRANAVARTAQAIVGAAKLDLDYEKLNLSLSKKGQLRDTQIVLKLGNET